MRGSTFGSCLEFAGGFTSPGRVWPVRNTGEAGSWVSGWCRCLENYQHVLCIERGLDTVDIVVLLSGQRHGRELRLFPQGWPAELANLA